jgi:YgiT-type zinc finger domain-containing protein
MSRKPESDGIPAEVVIAKLEAKLQAALDKRGLRRCQYCRHGILKPEVRDVVITREERSTIVRNIRGRLCDQCGHIEFDATTDSASRYAAAVDKLVFSIRAAGKWRNLNPPYVRPGDRLDHTLLHAMQATFAAYFSPIYMGAWLVRHGLQHAFDRVRQAYQHPKTQANAMVHKASAPLLSVLAWWDAEAGVWAATSDDVHGLATEAATVDELETKLKEAILELLFANKVQMQSARFRLTLIRDVQSFLNNTSPYSRNPQKEKRQMDKPNSGYTTYIEAIPDSDDLLITIPDEILESEDWRTGDVLWLDATARGIVLTNRSKKDREHSSTVPEQS